MISSVSSRFDSLPARPPTPPRDVSKDIEDAISFLDDCHDLDRQVLPQPPEPVIHTPSFSEGAIIASDEPKKVGFSAFPTYHVQVDMQSPGTPSSASRKRSPLSKSLRPGKSILKLSNPPAPLTPDDLDRKLGYFSPEIPGSFAKMLQSVVQHLASSSRESRLDAYLALNGSFRAYEEVPDIQAMIPKMSLIMQFLTRDMAWKDKDGNLDANIISQALRFTVVLVREPELREAIDDDFKAFIIDRSIAVMQQDGIPKQILKAQLFLLAQQRFSSLTMTAPRAERIITALRDIEEKHGGNSIVSTRLVLYQRLLEQAPGVLLSRISDWLGHVFHGMLSSINQIRVRAIEICSHAGLTLGSQPLAARTLITMLDTENDESQSYYSYFTSRLLEMVAEKDLGEYVPQIWAAVTLFFRSKRLLLDKWSNFKSWLLVIERCLNAGNTNVRYNAYIAWNKLVFAFMPDASTSKAVLSMLKVPLLKAMDKRGNERHARHHRQCAINSLYNLMHYSLRPGLTFEDYDSAWTNLVGPSLFHLIGHSVTDGTVVCNVLHGLLAQGSVVWNANTAFETRPFDPEKLPNLELRWVRSRLSNFLDLLAPLLESSMYKTKLENATLDATWTCFLRAIHNAGNQEVRTSNDLKQAIALLVNLYRKIWSARPQSSNSGDIDLWFGRFVWLIDITVEELRPSPFTEDMLATTKDDDVEVAPTPSNRQTKHLGPPRSPMLILFGLFFHLPCDIDNRSLYISAGVSILNQLISAKRTSSDVLELLDRSLYVWSRIHQPIDELSFDPFLPSAAILQVASAALDRQSSLDQVPSNSQSLGKSLQNAMNILTQTIENSQPYEDIQFLQSALAFYQAVCRSAQKSASEGAVVYAVMEPFAKAMFHMGATFGHTSLQLATSLVGNAVWPKDRRSIEDAKQKLWKVSFPTHDVRPFDVFENVYYFLVDQMSKGYIHMGDEDFTAWGALQKLVTSTVKFLKACPERFLLSALENMQKGFILFIEDKSKRTGTDKDAMTMVSFMWQGILEMLSSLPRKNNDFLRRLEPLLVAGLSSPHRDIVNGTINFWNESFDPDADLDYPDYLESVLRARSVDAEIILPSFSESGHANTTVIFPEFYKSEQVEVTQDETNRTPRSCRLYRKAIMIQQKSPIALQSRSPNLHRESPRRSARSTPKARLRHDDSQIHFAPIESSPIRAEEDSQLLTEHQKEVREQQHEDAQMFPEFSSSPIARSTNLLRGVPKRLDFTSTSDNDQEQEDFGTPTGLQDPNVLASDDLPSSPTPSSNREATPRPVFVEKSDITEFEDPPSSPPRDQLGEIEQINISPGHPLQTAYDLQCSGSLDNQHMVLNLAHGAARPVSDVSTVAMEDTVEENEDPTLDFEILSDCGLPTAQLQEEEEAAAGALWRSQHLSENESCASDEIIVRAHLDETDEITVADDTNGEQDYPGIAVEDVSRGVESEADDLTRVEDSFVAAKESSDRPGSSTTTRSQSEGRISRKRKRSSPGVYGSRKRKAYSPPKCVLRMLQQDQDQKEEDEDNWEDEIVVASSQVAASPEESPKQVEAIANTTLINDEMEQSEDFGHEEKGEPLLKFPISRPRGRSKRAGATISKAEEAPSSTARTSTRRIFTRSKGIVADDAKDVTTIKDTPAVLKRKRSSLTSTSNFGQDDHPTADLNAAPHLSQHSGVVVISPVRSTISQLIEHEEEHSKASGRDHPPATPTKQTGPTAIPEEIIEERVIATPRSIIGRLRATLTDLKGMSVPPEEEREFDDILFELRREVHEAARRAEEHQQ